MTASTQPASPAWRQRRSVARTEWWWAGRLRIVALVLAIASGVGVVIALIGGALVFALELACLCAVNSWMLFAILSRRKQVGDILREIKEANSDSVFEGDTGQ